MSTESQQSPMVVFMRPYGPPSHFKGSPDKGLEEWIPLYERYATPMSWTDTHNENNRIFALEDEAQH